MAPAQESGLRENCTSRLSERAEAGRTLDLSRLYSATIVVDGMRFCYVIKPDEVFGTQRGLSASYMVKSSSSYMQAPRP